MAKLGYKFSEESKLKMRIAHLGKKHSEEHKKNQSNAMKGIKKPPRSAEHCRKLSEAKKLEYLNGKISPFAKIWSENPSFLLGENNPKWISDRSKIKIGDRSLNDPLQKGWRKAVKDRDGWKCKISDENCSGKLEAHHILSWSEFPELRYKINNGITLCHHHHPRKKEDVVKLSPLFQSLVASLD